MSSQYPILESSKAILEASEHSGEISLVLWTSATQNPAVIRGLAASDLIAAAIALLRVASYQGEDGIIADEYLQRIEHPNA